MFVRKPLLCLDTNASIDVGVGENLHGGAESLDAQIGKIDDAWSNLLYDAACAEGALGFVEAGSR